MALAAIDPLVCEEVQLLADCFAPVFTTEIPAAAEDLIQRGLLRSLSVRASRECFLLAVTEEGRSYVETWVELQEALCNGVTLGNVCSKLATARMKTCGVVSLFFKSAWAYRSHQSC